MKICHGVDFLPQYHRVWGGAELAAYNLIDLLRREINSQSVIATKPLIPVKEDFEFFAVPVLEDYFGKIGSVLKLWTFDPLSFSKARSILREQRPDILHLHNFRTLSFSMVAAAKQNRVPVVFSIYDNWCLCPNHTLITKKGDVCTKFHGLHCFLCTYAHKKLSALFRKKFFNHFLNQIDVFIVLSKTMAHVLEKYGIPQEKIEFVPLPLSKATWQSESSAQEVPETNSLLFAGWISPHKGFKVLAEAMPHVLSMFPDTNLYVIETGADVDYKNSILDFIEKNNLKDNIHFMGKKSNVDVQGFLKRCEVVIVPEQWGIAWPIFLTEAMFATKPIIASNIGDIPFFVENEFNGFTVKPDDPIAFAQKIIDCLENRDLIETFGVRSRQKIKTICDNKVIYEKLMQVYERVIQDRGRK